MLEFHTKSRNVEKVLKLSIVQDKLKKMGCELPQCPTPVAAYLPAQRVGNLIYASGQTAWVEGVLMYQGQVGTSVSLDKAYESAKISALNCLSAISTIEDLDKIRIIRVTGYVNACSDFGDHPKVINGASELMEALFGENGKHARSAIGVASLPTQASVEIEVIAQVIQ